MRPSNFESRIKISKYKKIKQLKGCIYTLVKRANFDGLQHTPVSTKVLLANQSCGLCLK